MTRKLYEIAFEIGGKLQSSLRTSVMTAAGQLATLDRRLKELDARKMHGPGFEGFNANIDKTVQKLKGLKTQLREVQGAIQANEQRRSKLRGEIVDTAAMAIALAAPIRAAASFETAMLGVAKQVQGARDEGGKLTPVYFQMAEQIQAMARNIPLATNDIAEMVAAGARMGVARDELIKFTETSAMMASAFDLPAGELAEKMGKIAGLYKIPIPAIAELGDTINWLDDNAIAKGGDIIDFLTRTGGVAGAVKITGTQVAALGSTLLTLGERTETAGTATNAMLQKFAAADKGTAKFKEAMAELGLSTAEIQKNMQVDATGTILQVLDKIATMPKDQQLGIMVDLIGLEHSDTIAKLANNTAEFRKQLEMASSAEAKGSMSREFQAQRATTNAQMQIMKNRVTEVAVAFGTVLLPSVNATFGAIGNLMQPMAEFARQNPVITQGVVGLAVGLGALKVATLAAGYASTFVVGGYLQVKKTLLMVRTAYALTTSGMLMNASAASKVATVSRALSGTWMALSAVFAATPIGWLVIGVAALVAAGIALYRHWAVVKAFMSGVWEGFKEGMAPIGTLLTNLQSSMAWMQPVFSGIGSAVSSVAGWFRDLLLPVQYSAAELGKAGEAGRGFGQTVADGIKVAMLPLQGLIKAITWLGSTVVPAVRESFTAVFNYLSSIDLSAVGAAIMETLIAGIKAKAQAVVDTVKDTFSKVREYMPFSDAKRGPLSQLTASGMAIVSTLAAGVAAAPADAIAKQLQDKLKVQAQVTQQGGQMGTGLRQNGMEQQSRALQAGGGSSMSVTFAPQINLPAGSPEQTRQAADQALTAGMREFERKMRDLQEQQGRVSYA